MNTAPSRCIPPASPRRKIRCPRTLTSGRRRPIWTRICSPTSPRTLRSLCYDALSGFANVTIYDFTTRADWVLDLNNYKDALHYGQWINDAITECIAGGEYAVSSRETLDATTEKLRAWANAQIEAGGWIF